MAETFLTIAAGSKEVITLAGSSLDTTVRELCKVKNAEDEKEKHALWESVSFEKALDEMGLRRSKTAWMHCGDCTLNFRKSDRIASIP